MELIRTSVAENPVIFFYLLFLPFLKNFYFCTKSNAFLHQVVIITATFYHGLTWILNNFFLCFFVNALFTAFLEDRCYPFDEFFSLFSCFPFSLFADNLAFSAFFYCVFLFFSLWCRPQPLFLLFFCLKSTQCSSPVYTLAFVITRSFLSFFLRCFWNN